jgi:hypothetical protein
MTCPYLWFSLYWDGILERHFQVSEQNLSLLRLDFLSCFLLWFLRSTKMILIFMNSLEFPYFAVFYVWVLKTRVGYGFLWNPLVEGALNSMEEKTRLLSNWCPRIPPLYTVQFSHALTRASSWKEFQTWHRSMQALPALGRGGGGGEGGAPHSVSGIYGTGLYLSRVETKAPFSLFAKLLQVWRHFMNFVFNKLFVQIFHLPL